MSMHAEMNIPAASICRPALVRRADYPPAAPGTPCQSLHSGPAQQRRLQASSIVSQQCQITVPKDVNGVLPFDDLKLDGPKTFVNS